MEKRLAIEDVVDYLPRLNPVKRNTRPSSSSSELAKRLKKGGIDIVDLVNEEWQQDHSNSEMEKKGKPPAISWAQTRVSMNCQPRYTYESQTQPDLSILTANRKASEPGSEEERHLPSPGTLIARSATMTASSHPLLFGSSNLYSSSFNDEDLDVALANISEQAKISPQTNVRDVNIANNIGDIAVSLVSSPPIQHKIHHNGKTGSFTISSPESSRVQAVDSNIAEHGDTNISNWDTSPSLYLLS